MIPGLASNAGLLALSVVINAVCTLGVQIGSARVLPIEVFGLYASSAAIIAVVESMIVTRASDLTLNFVGEAAARGARSEARAIMGQIAASDAVITLSAAVIVSALGWLLASQMAIEPSWVALLSLSIPAQASYGVSKSLLVVRGLLKTQAALEITYSLCWAAASLIAVFIWGAPGLAVATVAGSLLRNGLAYWAARTDWAPIPSQSDVRLPTRTLWLWSGQALARNAVMRLSGQIDLFILAAVVSPAAIGQYKVAKTLASLPIRVAAPVWGALRPALYQAWVTADRPRFMRLVSHPTLVMLVLAVPGLAVTWLIAPAILTGFYGADYADAFTPLLLLLAGSWIFQGANGWFEFWLVFSKRRYWSTFLYAFFCAGVVLAAPLAEHVTAGNEATAMAAMMATLFGLMAAAAWGMLFLTKCAEPGGN